MSTSSRCLPALLGAVILFTSSSGSADPQPSSCSVSIRPGGLLVSLSGNATAIDACGNSRRIECGSSLFSGETVSTAAGSTAGVMLGEVLTLVGPSSAASIGVSADGTADVVLERGGVRMIDPRENGPPVRLRARDASARFFGNDAEAHVVDGRSGTRVTMCGWEAPLGVARGGADTPASFERCGDSRQASSTIALAASDAVAGSATCEARPAISTLAHLLPLPPVAGPPPGTGPPLPDVHGDPPPRTPCDNPGSGCGAPRSVGGAMVSEQPVGDGSFPGAGGTFPGGGGGALP